MKAHRVKYTIFNYDCWNHYKDFIDKAEAEKYAEYLKKQGDIGNVSVDTVETSKLYNV